MPKKMRIRTNFRSILGPKIEPKSDKMASKIEIQKKTKLEAKTGPAGCSFWRCPTECAGLLGGYRGAKRDSGQRFVGIYIAGT